MNVLLSEMVSKADPAQVAGLSRFFKTGPGQYGQGDKFLGIKVPVTRQVVKSCWQNTDFDQLEECICNEYHEIRLAALLTLVQIFTHARKDAALQQRCIDFYLSHTAYINNWDLVDLSCYELLGRWLLDKDKQILYDLARDGRTIWEQRIGIVSTMQFIRHGQLDDTYAIADIFLDKPRPLHDLLQKAVGWLLRDAGKRDEDRLRRYLSLNGSRMPRTMLRYAIEKFPPEERSAILKAH
ncbi:MAG: DNA alkylation repair protein [Bacteroidaceae bacterium]|nr:DNA alkylation repair protein [Bacteroidaceae bacterium]